MMHLKVKRILEITGNTAAWLCKETNIPASHMSEFLNGKRTFQEHKLNKIAAAFQKEWDLVTPGTKNI